MGPPQNQNTGISPGGAWGNHVFVENKSPSSYIQSLCSIPLNHPLDLLSDISHINKVEHKGATAQQVSGTAALNRSRISRTEYMLAIFLMGPMETSGI